MAPRAIQRIPLERLLLNLQNPRYDPKVSQRDALYTIAHDQGMKLYNLAEDIVQNGLNPSEVPIVSDAGDGISFMVEEGNRRIAALKLLASPSLLTSIGLTKALTKRFKDLADSASQSLPSEIDCVIMAREEAQSWILLKHTGENEGVGIVSWDGRARQRFRGSSPALQAIELVEQRGDLDQSTRDSLAKIAITNIERVLNTPEARQHLGVEVNNGHLMLVGPEEDAIARLSLLVSDVASRQIRVSDLDTKDQRVDYSRELASRAAGATQSATSSANTSTGTTPGTTGQGVRVSRRLNPERKSLIPKQFKVAIKQSRLNWIYRELQSINIQQFPNCGAVLLRVFVELAIDDFAQRHGISLKIVPKVKPGSTSQPAPKDMNLREKIRTVADHLEQQSLCSKSELKGARSMANQKDHILSVESLNAYVHNKDYSPTPSDLRTMFDNIQVFIERILTR